MTPHFSYDELIASQIASRRGIDNTPDEKQLVNLQFLAEELEDVRRTLGGAIYISSGFRCLLLNRSLGSKDSSSHIKGLAIDFTCPSFGSPHDIVGRLINSDIPFDQCIEEYSKWVHLGFTTNKKPRRQALVIDKDGVSFYSDSKG